MDLDRNFILTSLMTTYYSNIWAYIYLHTKDHYASDDLTQEVFVRVFNGLLDFRNESSHQTWIYTIARNICRDYRKSAFIRRVISIPGPQLEARSEMERNRVLSDVDRAILADELWASLFKLSVQQREVILLHLKEELSFREIGHIVNTKEVTVRARYRRGLERLRSMHNGGDDIRVA